jgi:hypothetical protein
MSFFFTSSRFNVECLNLCQQIAHLEKELVRERVAAKRLKLENDELRKLKAELQNEIAKLKDGSCGPGCARMSFQRFISTPNLVCKVKQWTIEELQDFWGILNYEDDLVRVQVDMIPIEGS